MKRIILFIVPILLIAGVIYYLQRDEAPSEKNEEISVEESLSAQVQHKGEERTDTAPAPQKDEILAVDMDEDTSAMKPDRGTPSAASKEEKVLTEEELATLDEYFEKVEADWKKLINELFIEKLGLSEREVKAYQKIRENFEQERLDSYQNFHQEMVEKYGDNYSYNPTEEEEHFTDKIKREYADELRKLIGDENYKAYLEALDSYNEKVKRNRDPESGILIIDF